MYARGNGFAKNGVITGKRLAEVYGSRTHPAARWRRCNGFEDRETHRFHRNYASSSNPPAICLSLPSAMLTTSVYDLAAATSNSDHLLSLLPHARLELVFDERRAGGFRVLVAQLLPLAQSA